MRALKGLQIKNYISHSKFFYLSSEDKTMMCVRRTTVLNPPLFFENLEYRMLITYLCRVLSKAKVVRSLDGYDLPKETFLAS